MINRECLGQVDRSWVDANESPFGYVAFGVTLSYEGVFRGECRGLSVTCSREHVGGEAAFQRLAESTSEQNRVTGD